MQKWTWAVANCTLRMIYYLDDCNLLNVQKKKKNLIIGNTKGLHMYNLLLKVQCQISGTLTTLHQGRNLLLNVFLTLDEKNLNGREMSQIDKYLQKEL